MTDLRLQRLVVTDCEERAVRAYFEWGRDPSLEPLDWNSATHHQRRRIALRGYELYDGWPAGTGNQITMRDALISVGINSRVIVADIVRLLARGDQAAPLLARVPDDALIEEATEDQLDALCDLIVLLSDAPHINWGKATKVLHTKRPGFVPILDGVVEDFLWTNFPHILGKRTSAKRAVQVFRGALLHQQATLNHIRENLAADGYRLSTARLLDYLIWIDWTARKRRSTTDVWEVNSLREAREKSQVAWSELTGMRSA